MVVSSQWALGNKMQNNRGVSLVELSIVIAIIGLLLAATFSGLSIKKSSEMRSFATDISMYQNAVEGFFSKYGALPGDMPDAWTYWDDGTNTVCGTTATECNGNNDGVIDIGTTGGSDSESYRFWQHLLLAEFIGGGYTGKATTSMQADIGINIPASKRTKVGYSVYSADTGGGARNEINLGAFWASNLNKNSALTPAEALAIDMKDDDGIPATGSIHGVDGNDVVTAGSCMTGTGSTSLYTVATTILSCRLTFPAKL
jgi:prepilin-type N-terminal cleavage/methylation domain-containing protein